MSFDLCPYCGTPLKETNWGNKLCPNCGIIEDIKSDKEDKGSYIG